MLNLLLLVISAYLLGSIPTSILVVKLVRKIDIRDYGSGNAGGTNVSRVAGWGWGVFVILIDACKGFLAAALLPLLFPVPLLQSDPHLANIIAGVLAMVGHVFPLFAGFRGGKGVATAAGIAIAITDPWWGMLAVLVVFGTLVATTRYMFLASIAGGTTFAVVMLLFAPEGAISLRIFAVAALLLLLILHRGNIDRFRRGVENRLGRRIEVKPEDSAEEEQS